MKYKIGIFKTRINTYELKIELLRLDEEDENRYHNIENLSDYYSNLTKALTRFLLEHFSGKEVEVCFDIKETNNKIT